MSKINAKEIEVSRLLEKNNFYIPPYQRGYAWGESAAEQLLNDLLNHLNKKKESDYYMGNIITYQEREGFHNKLVVVDGQQRITTFMLMITALKVSAFTSPILSEEEFKKIDEKIQSLVFEDVSKDVEEKKIKLFSSSREQTVKDILNCDIKEKNLTKDKWAKEIDKKYGDTNYYKNLVCFIKNISKKIESYDEYMSFINLLDRVLFVMIDIDNNEGVHEIFENINSKGVDLSLTDLTKNFIYILLDTMRNKNIKENNLKDDELISFIKSIEKIEEDVSRLFEDEIESLQMENDSFITNYLIYLKGEHFNKKIIKKVYAELKEYIKELILNENKTIMEILEELKEQIALIKYIEEFTTDNSSNQYDLAMFLNKSNLTSVIFPFVYKMAKIYEVFEDGELVINGNFEDFIILMDKFFSRRMLVNSSTKNFNKFTPTLLAKVETLEEHSLKTMENLLTDNNNDNGSLMPSKSEAMKFFRDNQSPYKSNKSKELKHILFRINFFMTMNSNEGIALTDEEYKKFTIEHVMPQNPKSESNWLKENLKAFNSLDDKEKKSYEDEIEFYNEKVHNWGNLTITQDNSSLSNDDFEKKIDIFESSTLKINQWIARQSDWTLKEMEIRKGELQEIIKKYF